MFRLRRVYTRRDTAQHDGASRQPAGYFLRHIRHASNAELLLRLRLMSVTVISPAPRLLATRLFDNATPPSAQTRFIYAPPLHACRHEITMARACV